MAVTAVFVYAVVASGAAVLGAIAGRVFAVEAENRLTAMFAGTYVGAGVGLLTAVFLGSLLTLIVQLLNTASSTWFNALEVAGNALIWGVAGGAGGGLVVGLVVAMFNIRTR